MLQIRPVPSQRILALLGPAH